MTKETKDDQVEKTREKLVRCNGGAKGSGHPAVYLSINEKGFVVCPYCSQLFKLDAKD